MPFMQGLLGRFLPYIESLPQPFKLLQRDRLRGAAGIAWPGEFYGLEVLARQVEAIAVRVQHLDLVAVAVHEQVQRAVERIEAQRLLDEHRQAADRLAQVGRVAA